MCVDYFSLGQGFRIVFCCEGLNVLAYVSYDSLSTNTNGVAVLFVY